MKLFLEAKNQLGKQALQKMFSAYAERFKVYGRKDWALKRALFLLKVHVEKTCDEPFTLEYIQAQINRKDYSQLTAKDEKKIVDAMGLDLIKYGCTLDDVKVVFK